MEGIRKAMNERNLNEGQWEDRKQWSLGVGQRRKSFETDIYIYMCIYIYIYGTVYQTVRCHVPEVRHHRIRQLPTYTVVTFRKIRCKKKKNIAQVAVWCTYYQIYMYTRGSPAEIQIQAHWNLTGRSITASPHVSSPSSILPPPSSQCAFIPSRKNKKACYLNLFTF